MNPTGGICTKIVLLLLLWKEIYIVYSCCIHYLISCAPFTCVAEFPLALIVGLLLDIGYTHCG